MEEDCLRNYCLDLKIEIGGMCEELEASTQAIQKVLISRILVAAQ